jgi:hypothetical protein
MSIISPVTQEVITKDVSYNVIVSATDAVSISIYDGVNLLGSATDNLDNTWTYSWTPTVADMDVNIRANIDGVYTDSVQCVVSRIGFDQDITTWTKSGVTVTGSHTDPDGGSSAYFVSCPTGTGTQRRISDTPTITPSEKHSGYDVWVKPNNMNVLMLYPLGDGSDHNGYIDLTTGETRTRNCYLTIVEELNGWYRLWFAQVNSAVNPPGLLYLYMCNDIGDNTPDTTDGDGMYFYQPHIIEDVPPLTDYQKLAIELTASASGKETWSYTHPYNITVADVELSKTELFIIKPIGWTSDGEYRVVWCLPALQQTTEDVADIMLTGGYADTYDCIIAVPTVKGEFEAFTYWAEKNDGSFNCGALVSEALLPFVKDKLAGGSTRNHHGLVGYSKSAWGALSVLMLHNDVFGFASVFDGNWDQVIGTNGSTEQFGTQVQMDLYDPSLIAGTYSTELGDRARIHFEGTTSVFADDLATITAALDTASIGYTSSGVDYGTALEHVWDEDWVPAAMEAIDSSMVASLAVSSTNTGLSISISCGI